jgi:hypothetical protein
VLLVERRVVVSVAFPGLPPGRADEESVAIAVRGVREPLGLEAVDGDVRLLPVLPHVLAPVRDRAVVQGAALSGPFVASGRQKVVQDVLNGGPVRDRRREGVLDAVRDD